MQVYILYIPFVFAIFVQLIKNNMKPYFSKPTKLIRVNISQQGCDTEHLMFQDCDLLQCAQELMGFSHEMVTSADSNPYEKKLTIQCREWENSRNGLSNTFSFFGPSPSSMKSLILRHFGYGLEYEDK